MSKVNSLYKAAQQDFYIAADMAWGNFQDNLAEFTKFKGKYKDPYGPDAILELKAAKALPDDAARSSVPETLRVTLVPLGAECINNWKMLRSYVRDAFSEELHATMLRAAGSEFYEKAINYNWSELDMMNEVATKFIDNHLTELKNGTENMPDTFPGRYADGKTAFDGVYKKFLKAQQGTGSGTDAKITANNKVYKKMMAMLKDGRLIFNSDENKKDLFTYETLLSFISGTGNAGLKVWLIDSVTELPIPKFVATLLPGKVSEEGNADGTAVLITSEGIYNLHINAPGYEEYREDNVRITTGTISRRKIKLVKLGA